ncbi:E3 SUMO-protein ligase NSE2 [Clupea harengus]|uniref:E3 SUMO-protein ligase NSE2 n=1 Tax=Clupea harengus TaxID=7950 RepID=A0A6P8G7D9_CLUHA|nr:E3 SUMO-protein ligase NSE2 [Clupea harengus]
MTSLSAVNSTLTSLKTCQTDIGTGMDMVTEVALDLVECEGNANSAGLKKLEDMMLECAKLDREINFFVEAVDSVTARARQDPAALVALSNSVKAEFSRMMEGASDAELGRHAKVVAFKDSIKNSLPEANQPETEAENLDEDIALTQSQINFTCPLTQVEMVNPMRNKKCQHYYDQEAALSMIKSKQKNGKKFRCPVVGCDNKDVKPADLVLDPIMKRRIQQFKKQNAKK